MHFTESSLTSARVNNVLLTPPLLVTKQYNLEEGLNLNTEFRRLLFCSIGVTRTPFKDIFASEQSNFNNHFQFQSETESGAYWATIISRKKKYN